jgi:hypothetical protein
MMEQIALVLIIPILCFFGFINLPSIILATLIFFSHLRERFGNDVDAIDFDYEKRPGPSPKKYSYRQGYDD